TCCRPSLFMPHKHTYSYIVRSIAKQVPWKTGLCILEFLSPSWGKEWVMFVLTGRVSVHLVEVRARARAESLISTALAPRTSPLSHLQQLSRHKPSRVSPSSTAFAREPDHHSRL